MDNIIATTTDGRFRVRLVPDEDARNPREDFDHLAHVVTIDTHLGQYTPIDKDGGPFAEAWDRVSWNRWKGIEIFTRWAGIFHDAIVIESRPARGPVSLWYLLREDAEDLGMLPEAYLDAERAEYEAWAEGDVTATSSKRPSTGSAPTRTTPCRPGKRWTLPGATTASTGPSRPLGTLSPSTSGSSR
ncbi:hypothetical protein ACGFRG_25895 [Streptomyces sp. NPDC048696]|uniref:hypothetical protein n=1 Tax=Streptomyces sp. NPDC048696 TaxID=3365585 RepID=UPI00371FFF08